MNIVTLLLFVLCFLRIQSFAQVENDELDDEYTERSSEELAAARGYKKVWTWHPSPATYKGNLDYEPYDQNQVAILGDGKILFLEKISDDIEIVGQWFDFYVVYTESINKLEVKGRNGKPISSMFVPDNFDIIGVFKDGLSDHEIMYTTHAFDLDNMETDEIKRYDKYCKLKSVK
ncbi:MAG: hypothetical protein ACK48V_12225 [Crocinitomicaceae bacterium]|jgi:hypothetical protein